MSESNQQVNTTKKGSALIGVGGALAALAVLFAIGIIPRLREQQQPAYGSAETSATTVLVVHPRRPPKTDHLALPGNVQAIQQTTINAQAAGYVKNIYVDIGDKVTAGQVIATIATPENDQMTAQAQAQQTQAYEGVAQAKATLASTQGSEQQAYAELSKSIVSVAQANSSVVQAQAQFAQAKQQAEEARAQLKLANANLKLAKVSNDREQQLVVQGFAAKQLGDQTEATYQTSLATVQSSQDAVAAADSNVTALQAAVRAAQQNVEALNYDIESSRAALASAKSNVVSSQASVQEANANYSSSAANTQRYVAQQQFQNIVAPFSGIITARYVDVGALVSATGSTATTSPMVTPANLTITAPASGGSGALFGIASVNRMRIYVSVPQDYATSIKVGQKADVTVSELPRRHLVGIVARTSGALDPQSRTLLTEVDLDNSADLIHAGVFANVTLTVPRQWGVLIVPDNAIVTNANGTQVAEVLPNNTVHYQTVTVGRDYGQILEITSGLRNTSNIVLNPLENLVEGESVKSTPGEFLPTKAKH